MFIPVVPFGGLAGFSFLERTFDAQKSTSDQSFAVRREVEYLQERLPTVNSATDLLSDRRLLGVVLTAFGMEDRIDQRALLRQSLEQGVQNPDSLANRIADPRLVAFVSAFDFGNEASPVGNNEQLSKLTEQYESAIFLSAVGQVDRAQRLALQFKDDVDTLLSGSASEKTLWLRVLGSASLREVFAKSLNVPPAVATLDIDRQADIFAQQMAKFTGQASVRSLSDTAAVDKFIARYFALNASTQNGANVSSPALQLIAPAVQGASFSQNILLARL